jgi:hypothetical protein
MERATKTFKTPSGNEIVINQWLTGREHEYIQEPMYNKVSVGSTIESGRPEAEIKGLDISFMTESTHRTIEKMVVSVDGIKDDILNKVLDMKNEDYEAILKAIEETTTKKG